MNGERIYPWVKALCITAFSFALLSPTRLTAQTGLQVTYGSKGVQTLSFNGVVLENLGANSLDSFHIWHMKSSDLNGDTLSSGQYGWGESNNGTYWNAQTLTETYTFSWGSIATHFVQNGNNLDMIVTETNNAGSGIAFDGAEIYPFALHFPSDPAAFHGYTQYAITTRGPGVSVADFGSGVVTSVVPNEALSMYGGWKSQGGAIYSPMMTTTAPDGLATFLPRTDLPLQPGNSLSYTVSLRFTPEGTAANVSDAYASFAATYPNQMTWSDRRIIGTAYLASSPPGSGDITQPGGFPGNPRRYFNDPSVNIYSAAGLLAFQNRMLAQAAVNVNTARSLGSQGVITWDIEGEQYAQNTSYVCSPDQISSVAPEMESIVSDSTSSYFGLPLVDAYFKTMSNAGLKTGVCLRPQAFGLSANGTASQSVLTGNSAIIANLETKAKYANARWGTTIFYVDSTVDSTGGTLDPAIFQQIITDMPSFLFIPEESTPRYYAYTAPFYTFLFHTDLGTPAAIYQVYPHAFGANLVNDVSVGTLAQYAPQLSQSVARGDILMGHADYWQANDPTLVTIYAAAGVGTSTPVQGTPTLSWQAPAAIVYGTPLTGAQLNATSNVAGSFTYTPALGTLLSAGRVTLTTTFTPTDATSYKSVTASVPLSIKQAVPVISWAAPGAIGQGTALSTAQLNATANVAGTFAYTPMAGDTLAVGTTTLQVVFTPQDTADYRIVAGSATLVVTPTAVSKPVITWTTPNAIPTGTPLSATQLNATANVAGTFQYSPAAGTILAAGVNGLQVTFTPSDSLHYSSAAALVLLTVTAVTAPSGNLAILYPGVGSTVSRTIAVQGYVNLPLDPAGSYLIVDGQADDQHRVTQAPYLYTLDTTALANGPHTLQLWAHDIGNNTTLSGKVQIYVEN